MPPASMLLGTSQGGGILYVEPPAAVGTNNELAAARGEALGLFLPAALLAKPRAVSASQPLCPGPCPYSHRSHLYYLPTGEAFSAEEAVLYDLTARLMGIHAEVEASYQVRAWACQQLLLCARGQVA